MAEDGITAAVRKRRKQQAEEEGPMALGPEARVSDPADDAPEPAPGDPKTLPPWTDPHGRKVMPRHKRLALKRARRLKLDPVSHNHALYLLAEQGIDIFGGDDSMLSIADRAGQPETSEKSDSNLPAAIQDPKKTDVLAGGEDQTAAFAKLQAEREAEVKKIQRDLVRRRRRRLFALALRLIVFVALPTAAMGYYYFNIATPMYGTESEFVIQTSDNPAAAGGLGGLLAGTGFATSQDSIVVQGYLGSREAFLRLNEDHDYIAHFQDPEIDFMQRVPPDATIDDAYAYFLDKVTIGYDPTEGIIRMTVVAATPEASQTFAEALVSYAEERVDGLTQEARGDQLAVAMANRDEAERKMLEAEQRVVGLQQQRGVLSADVELQSQMSIIQALELELENKRFERDQLLQNDRPNPSQVRIVEEDIARREARIRELRGELTDASEENVSLARIQGELRIAESELATRHLMLQEAIGTVETARLEASRQVRYLSLGVAPVAPVEPSFPRKIEGTILAFLLFTGIYILVSLTVSILREQVSV